MGSMAGALVGSGSGSVGEHVQVQVQTMPGSSSPAIMLTSIRRMQAASFIAVGCIC